MGIADQGVTPGRTSLIQAVNQMLEAIGEQTVASLEGDQNDEAAMAKRKLLEIHQAWQANGWAWNRSVRRFYRDAQSGEIVVPANIAQFSPDILEYRRRYTLRGQRVFDTQEGTFSLEITVIEAAIVESLSWDDAPQAYNYFATMKASSIFIGQVLGDGQNRMALQEAQLAWEQLRAAEAVEDQPNVLTDGYGLGPFRTFHPALGVSRRSSGGGLRV
jgi:hypothetical protein